MLTRPKFQELRRNLTLSGEVAAGLHEQRARHNGTAPGSSSGLFHGFATRLARCGLRFEGGKLGGSNFVGGELLRKPYNSPWRPETPGAVVCATSSRLRLTSVAASMPTGATGHDSSRSRWGSDGHGLAPGSSRGVRPGVRSGRSPFHVLVQVDRLATDVRYGPVVLQDRRPQRAWRGWTVHSTNGDDPGRRSGAGQELLEPRPARIARTGGEPPQVRIGRGQASGVVDVGSPGTR